MIKPREILHFTPPIHNKGEWMLGLTDIEVYNSLFNITKHNNKFELCKFLMKKVVVLQMKKLEMRSKETWIFQFLQLSIYKMI